MTLAAEAHLDENTMVGDLNFDPVQMALTQGAEDVFIKSFDSVMIGILGRRGSTKSGLAAYFVAEKVAKEQSRGIILNIIVCIVV